MKTRICPVSSCRAPVEGWEPFLAHVYEEHTEGTEKSRLAQAQGIFERRPGTPGERTDDH